MIKTFLTNIIAGLVIISSAFSFSANAAQNLGKKIEPLKKSSGSPSFTVQYAESANLLDVNFSTYGNQFVSNPNGEVLAPTYLALYNKETGELITPWTIAAVPATTVLPGFTLTFKVPVPNDSRTKIAIRSMRKIAVLIAIRGDLANLQPTGYVDLAELGSTNPGNIQNLDTFDTGCP